MTSLETAALSTSPAEEIWRPESWRRYPAAQQPNWPDERAARSALRRIRELPGLVSADECATLQHSLAEVAHGRGFVVQGGDCAETFGSLSSIALQSRCRLLASIAHAVTERSRLPAVVIGRIAGQYAKPRTAAAENIVADGSLATVPIR